MFPAYSWHSVKEHVHFLKDVRDARTIRMRILECVLLELFFYRTVFTKPSRMPGFTQASQLNCSESEKRKLLNFVVVGGGPTVSDTARASAALHSCHST